MEEVEERASHYRRSAGRHRAVWPRWLPPSSTGRLQSPRRSCAAKSCSTRQQTGPDRRTCSRSWAGSKRSTVGRRRPPPRGRGRDDLRGNRRDPRSCQQQRPCPRPDRDARSRASGRRACLGGMLRNVRTDARRRRSLDRGGGSAEALLAQDRNDEAESWLELAQNRAASRTSALSGRGAARAPSCSPARVLSRRLRRSRARPSGSRSDDASATTASSCSTSQRSCTRQVALRRPPNASSWP